MRSNRWGRQRAEAKPPPNLPMANVIAYARTAILSLGVVLVTCAVRNAVPVARLSSEHTDSSFFLLVASPDMPDPLFQQTVILILPPSVVPIVAGIVINKPTKMTLGQLLGHLPTRANGAQPVYFGGPVDMTSPAILMRAPRAPNAAAHLFADVYIGVDANSVREFLQRPGSEKDLRLFLGRAQWTLDQLHSEILRGAWSVTKASPELVFNPDPASVWQVLVQKAKLRQVERNSGVRSDPLEFSLSVTTPTPMPVEVARKTPGARAGKVVTDAISSGSFRNSLYETEFHDR
jgi:putative transcriptional regulator